MNDGYFSSFQRHAISSILKHFDRLPQHIGIVMDGNRRYARIHNQARKEGHASGFQTMSRLLSVAYSARIKCITVYAFSIENFNRSKQEVDDLMDIARKHLKELVAQNGVCNEFGVRINVLGKIELLPEDIRELIKFIVSSTQHNETAVLNLCMPYTARDDMAHAIKNIASNRELYNITTNAIQEEMYTNTSPPLDLLIRTSGTYRLSDFLLWETTSETVIHFVNELWPEYTPFCLFKSILYWRSRR